MLKIDFERPLTALEVRDPAIDALREVAEAYELYAAFEQRQQAALTGHPRQKRRQRIGNGKHKDWFINFQIDPLHISRPRIVGTLVLKSAYLPEYGQYGGWDYGKYDEARPTYASLRVLTASEAGFNHLTHPDPKDELLLDSHEALLAVREYGSPDRLFSVLSLGESQPQPVMRED